MKKSTARFITLLLATGLLLGLTAVYPAAARAENPLVLQNLNYTENPIDIPNPDRGFYYPNDGNVVPVTGGTSGGSAGLSSTTINGVAIAPRISHMYFDLRNFSSQAGGTTRALTESALAYIRATLQKVRNSEGVAIVRFVYHQTDTYNRTNGPEPTGNCTVAGHMDKNWIQYHIYQLKPILHEYEDVIMCVDGGFFGSWGEMHTTTFARSAANYVWLLDALLDAVPASRSILVHAGGFLAWYNGKYGTNYNFTTMNNMPPPVRGTPEHRFGMFNDSFCTNSSDNGSLSEGTGLVGGTYDRNRVLTWIRNQGNFYGGETNDGSSNANYTRAPNVIYESTYAHTSHLNSDWYRTRLTEWSNFNYTQTAVEIPLSNHPGSPSAIFDPVYNGKRGLEFIRDRLGYRLVLREAKVSELTARNGVLSFEGKIQNVGFGNIVNQKNVAVILKPKAGGSTYSALSDIDARDWLADANRDNRPSNTAAWRDLDFSINMSSFGNVPPGAYDIYLKINDPKETSANRRCVRFANNGTGIWDAALGANLIGTTQITLESPVSYPIAIASMQNGTVKVTGDKTQAEAGETIFLTPMPDSGYRLVGNSLKYNGNPVVVNDDIYSFMMSANGVTITAEFEPIPSYPSDLVLSASTVTARPGEIVTIDISIENNPGIKSFNLNLAYDNIKLEFFLLDTETGLDTSPLDGLGTTTPGGSMSQQVSLAWIANGNSLLTNDGRLFSVAFKVKDNAAVGMIPLTLTGQVTQMPDALDAAFVNGAVNVERYKLGDVNNDGAIDMVDVNMIQGLWLDGVIYMSGGGTRAPTPAELLAADINKDGRVDANDLLLILRYVVGGYGIILE